MPLKLNVGLSRKIGLPDDGSLGASCHVELELDGATLRSDAAGFRQQVELAFSACSQAVQDELARQQGAQQASVARRAIATAEMQRGRQGQARGRNTRVSKRATANEVRCVKQMINRIESLGAGADNLMQKMFGKDLCQLSGLEIKGLIASLREMEAGNIRPSNATCGAAL